MNLPPDVAQHPVAYFVAVAFGAIVVGLVCGLIPLAAGALTKQKRLAILGFTACFVGGLLGGVLLAVPLALGFTITIIVKWKNMAEHNEPTQPTGGT